MGCAATNARLLTTLEAYERAEKLAGWFPDVRPIWEKADALHNDLTGLAMACGFEPAGFHRHLTVLEFAQQRAAVVRRMLVNHVVEARGAA